MYIFSTKLFNKNFNEYNFFRGLIHHGDITTWGSDFKCKFDKYTVNHHSHRCFYFNDHILVYDLVISNWLLHSINEKNVFIIHIKNDREIDNLILGSLNENNEINIINTDIGIIRKIFQTINYPDENIKSYKILNSLSNTPCKKYNFKTQFPHYDYTVYTMDSKIVYSDKNTNLFKMHMIKTL